MTYISTANVVLYEQAELRLCECDPVTYNLTIADLERVVTKRTKAVIAVDMNGLPIEYGPIGEWCRARGVMGFEAQRSRRNPVCSKSRQGPDSCKEF